MTFQYQFEWDTAKARQNAKKHRITFERGATIFLDPSALSLFDEQHSDDEERCGQLWVWITLVRCWLFAIHIVWKGESVRDYA